MRPCHLDVDPSTIVIPFQSALLATTFPGSSSTPRHGAIFRGSPALEEDGIRVKEATRGVSMAMSKVGHLGVRNSAEEHHVVLCFPELAAVRRGGRLWGCWWWLELTWEVGWCR
jgi:hypothetical protein